MSDELLDRLVATGGICVPIYPATVERTYRVQGRLRRWWFRRTGWSTSWTVEEDFVPFVPPNFLASLLPSFSALRGGIDFNREPSAPLTPWQKRKFRLAWKLERARMRLAYRIAPSLRDRGEDDW